MYEEIQEEGVVSEDPRVGQKSVGKPSCSLVSCAFFISRLLGGEPVNEYALLICLLHAALTLKRIRAMPMKRKQGVVNTEVLERDGSYGASVL